MNKQRQLGLKCLNASWQIMRAHKSLLIFPSLGYLCKYAIFAAIITPFIHQTETTWMHKAIPPQTTLLVVIIFSLLLFVVNNVLFFFNSAIVETLLQIFKHATKPSIWAGFKRAILSYPRVFSWALFASTIGITVNLLPKNGEYFQKTRRWMHHNHWQIASQFGLIRIIDQKAWPINACQASSTLVATLWGSPLYQYYKLSWLFILCRLAALIPLIVGSLIGGHIVLIVSGAITLALMLSVSTFSQVVYTITRVACYCQAHDGFTPPPFTQEIIEQLYQQR